MKYIIYEGVAPYSGAMEKKDFAILFSEDLVHSLVARGLHDHTGRHPAKIVSAGFFYAKPCRTVGHSESLGKASRPEDVIIICETYSEFVGVRITSS